MPGRARCDGLQYFANNDTPIASAANWRHNTALCKVFLAIKNHCHYRGFHACFKCLDDLADDFESNFPWSTITLFSQFPSLKISPLRDSDFVRPSSEWNQSMAAWPNYCPMTPSRALPHNKTSLCIAGYLKNNLSTGIKVAAKNSTSIDPPLSFL